MRRRESLSQSIRRRFAFDGTGSRCRTLSSRAASTRAMRRPSRSLRRPILRLRGAQFAELVFHESNGAAPDAHMVVAVKGTRVRTRRRRHLHPGTCTFQIDSLTTNFVGVGCATYCGLAWVNRFTPDPHGLSDHDHVDLDDLRQRVPAGTRLAITSTSTSIRTPIPIRPTAPRWQARTRATRCPRR